MTLSVQIRPLALHDLVIAAAIHLECFQAEAWSRQAIADVLAMPGARGRLAVDAGDGRPVGFSLMSLVCEDAELLTVGVMNSARRQGAGTALVNDFLNIATAQGATNAFLEVAEDNEAAFRLYCALGFLAEGWRHDYYRRPGNRRVAARLLRCPLNRPG